MFFNKLDKIKFLIIVACIVVLSLIAISVPKKAYALSWYEKLMTDDAFINKNAMTASQIQAFLVARGSYLANYTIPSKDYVSNCPTQEGAGQKASTFIYNTAKEIGINPQVILVTMEKEESLISLSSPSQTRLQWAMGYGYYSGSPLINPGNCDLYVGGFGRQIYWGTKFYRNRYDNVSNLQGPGSSHAGDTVTITTKSWESATTQVYLSNRATALLYRYTPYIYNGNYNFYILINRWFGGGLPLNASPGNYEFGAIPDTTLRKNIGLGGKTYYHLIHGTNRYSFGSDIYLVSSFGHNYTTATTIAVDDLNALDWQGVLKTYIASPNGTNYYIAGGLKYKVYPSTVMKRRWGFNLIEAFSMPAELVSAIPTAPVAYLTGYIRGSSYSTSYFVDRGGAKYQVYNNAAFKARWGLKLTDLTVLPQPIVNRMLVPNKRYLSGLIKGVGGRTVYYIDKGLRYPVYPSSAFWARWGFKKSDVVTISLEQVSAIRKTGYLKGLVRTSPRHPLYYIDNYGKRFRVPSGLDVWGNWRFSVNQISIISTGQLSFMKKAGYLSRNVRGHIYSTTCRMTDGRCPVKSGLPSPSIISQAQFNYLPK